MVEKYKFISNSLSMIVNRLAQSITAFVLTAAIARNLGAEAIGQYLLAYSYYFIFVGIASQGLKILFTRELAREPQKTLVYRYGEEFEDLADDIESWRDASQKLRPANLLGKILVDSGLYDY
ncbi:lipopolysaccharide biosynthesis protein, partial [Nostoc sp. CHAB 5715]|uniref:lipopolysaccharide biosynthesis protein n=1 Tax=Nostoc sp. CHAB 5715 TaxID=2780400 RepID=UPI0034D238AB|nr:hypothetical protein [Nostoc sp. CHAB 5715]